MEMLPNIRSLRLHDQPRQVAHEWWGNQDEGLSVLKPRKFQEILDELLRLQPKVGCARL